MNTIIAAFLILIAAMQPQGAVGNRQGQGVDRAPAPAGIFAAIQSGILSGNAEAFSRYFGKQVSVSLRGRESGYFSSNQAFYIIQDYIGARHTVSFRFTTVDDHEPSVYATGGGTFLRRGMKEIFQVYVALSKDDNGWTISQLNVY